MLKKKMEKLIIDALNIISSSVLTHLKEFIKNAEPKLFFTVVNIVSENLKPKKINSQIHFIIKILS